MDLGYQSAILVFSVLSMGAFYVAARIPSGFSALQPEGESVEPVG